jgi:hypothetical protein
MKQNNNHFTGATTRLITVAVLFTTLVFVPGVVLAIDKDAHEERTELRIKDLRAKLKITSTQEEQWSKVAQTMLEDAKTMDALTQTRVEHAKDITAVDDLKSYGEIAEAHANGIKKLIPVFTDLYASMTDEQKKTADAFFREGSHKHKHKKSGGK